MVIGRPKKSKKKKRCFELRARINQEEERTVKRIMRMMKTKSRSLVVRALIKGEGHRLNIRKYLDYDKEDQNYEESC